MVEVSKSKFISRHSEFKIFKQQNQRPLFNDLSNRSTFLGHPMLYHVLIWVFHFEGLNYLDGCDRNKYLYESNALKESWGQNFYNLTHSMLPF